MTTGLGVLIGYLIGSVPFSYIVARVSKGIDLRRHGSKNVGATNVFFTVGPMAGILAGMLDTGKGIIAILVARKLFLNECDVILTGLASIVGHNWPVYLGFVGGKGVATSLGILACLVPKELFIVLGAWAVIVSVSRYVTLGGIIAGPFLPLLVWYFERSDTLLISTIIIIGLLGGRTFLSIKSLVNGKECKIGSNRDTLSLT